MISALVMGIIAVVLYNVLYWLLGYVMGERVCNGVAVLIAIALAACVYFISMIKIGGYTKDMLLAFPKGALLARIAEKLHLI